MTQKNATPTAEQQLTICRAGLNPAEWVVVKEMLYRMVICNRKTKPVRMIGK